MANHGQRANSRANPSHLVAAVGHFSSEDSGDPRESDTHQRMTTRSGQHYKDSPMPREAELESGVGGGPGRLPEGGDGDGGMATLFHMLQA